VTLRSLILSLGSTLGDAARATEVDPALFDRIDAGRQPLPLRLAQGLASFLGTETATVLAEVYAWTASTHPMFFRPVPGIPGVDFLSAPTYTPPAAIPRIVPDLPAVFAFVSDTGAGDTDVSRRGRHDGTSLSSVAATGLLRPRATLWRGGLLWTVGTLFSGAPPALRALFAFDPGPPVTLAFAGSFDLDEPRGRLVEDPLGFGPWICQRNGSVVSRLDEFTGAPDTNVDVSPALPEDLWGEGGKLFVALTDGSVARIDPGLAAIEASVGGVASGAKALGGAGDGTLYVVGRLGELRTIDLGTYVLSAPLVLTGAAINEPESLYVDATHVYVSDRTNPASDARVVRIDRQTLVATARTYPVAAAGFPAGRLAFDGLYLWMPDEGGPLRKLLPSTLETLLEVPGTTGCSAVAALLA
jgi:hypothetical protein